MKRFAIGDVHGDTKKLAVMMDHVFTMFGKDDEIVFLGDYIDRGPDSSGAIKRVRSLQNTFPGRVIALKGNHEEFMELAEDEPLTHMHWMQNGGGATLKSYEGDDRRRLDDLAWIKGLRHFYWPGEGQHYFVHAGTGDLSVHDPQLTDDVRLWNRPRGDWYCGPRIVHGHTPLERPFHGENRTNLDTGAVFAGGRLTCGVFEDEDRDRVEMWWTDGITVDRELGLRA